ncbi:MAG: branched-chain amino acid aminotransferase [Myxococcota bacterium]|jgi:branched-chain amino acid aminotransferase
MLQKYDERNTDLIVNIGGELVHRDQARISPFDSLAQGGDGVWEGLRLYDGQIFRLDTHLERLRSSAKALAFADIPSDAEITEQLKRTLKANNMHDGVHIRLTLSRGEKVTSGMDPRLNTKGSLLIVLAEYKAPVYSKSGLKLMTSTVRRFRPDTLDPNIHHNNLVQSILAKVQANAAGADDALMLDTLGFVAETNATHVFIVDGGVLWTPSTRACPEGVTRDSVLRLCEANNIECRVGDISLTAVYRASEMFCTGTMGEIAAIGEVDGRVIGDGKIGPMAEQLSKMFSSYVLENGTRVCE